METNSTCYIRTYLLPSRELMVSTLSQKSLRLLIFTVSTGGYDIEVESEPRISAASMSRVDFIRFVDRFSLLRLQGRKTLWQTVLLNASCRDCSGESASRALSREIKIMPHRFAVVWKYNASMYVDSNVRIHHSPWPIFEPVFHGNSDLAAYTFGRTLDGEAEWVRRYFVTKVPRFRTEAAQDWVNRTLTKQVIKYKRHGDHLFNRTLYGKVIVRRHSACVRQFGELWWHEYTKGVPRDQISFHYCTAEAGRRCGLRFASLGWNGRHGPRFTRFFHVHFSAQQKGRLVGFR